FVVGGNAVTDWIKCQSIHQDDFCAVALGAAQHRIDAGNQFAGGKRLGDVIIGAGVEALDLVVLFALGGEHDDGNFAGGFVALEAAGQFDAAGAGQHPVQQNQVGAIIHDAAVGDGGVLGFQPLKARQLQRHGNHFADGFFVVNYQYFGFRHVAVSGFPNHHAVLNVVNVT